jgi:hypothetical protein
MAAPTPTIKTFWDGRRGLVRWYAAWTAGAPDELADSVVLDVSALSPIPNGNKVKLRSADISLNGNFQATLEYDNIASGVVNTATAGTLVTWVSGDQFDTNWVSENFGQITINSVDYTITSVDSATQITLASDPGDQAGVAYSYDGTIDRFIGQSDATYQFQRDYSDGPNSGLIPPLVLGSSFLGDIMVTTSGAASGDEMTIVLVFDGR